MNEQIADAILGPLVTEYQRLKKSEVVLRDSLENLGREKAEADKERDRAIEMMGEYRIRMMRVGRNMSMNPWMYEMPITMDRRIISELSGAELEEVLADVMIEGMQALLRDTPAEETFRKVVLSRLRKR